MSRKEYNNSAVHRFELVDRDFKKIGVACLTLDKALDEAEKYVRLNRNQLIKVIELKAEVEMEEPVTTVFK
jgi:hypothetical protein